MKIIHIKLRDNREQETKKELEILKHELNISSNTEVIRHLIHNYRKTIGNTVLNYEPRHMFKITYSDRSTGFVLLSQSELKDYKRQKHYSNFTNDDVMVTHYQKLEDGY